MNDLTVPASTAITFDQGPSEPVVLVMKDGPILWHGKEITTFEEAVGVIRDIVRLLGERPA